MRCGDRLKLIAAACHLTRADWVSIGRFKYWSIKYSHWPPISAYDSTIGALDSRHVREPKRPPVSLYESFVHETIL